MGRSRVVRPEITRLDISDGDWLIVKRRLNAGEQRAQYARIYRNDGGGRMTVEPWQTGLAIVLAYLLDWSLVDEDGQVIDIREADDDTKTAALNAIDWDSFVEIKLAIEAHEAANTAATEEKKMIPSGAASSEPTSPLLVGVAGATSGSSS